MKNNWLEFAMHKTAMSMFDMDKVRNVFRNLGVKNSGLLLTGGAYAISRVVSKIMNDHNRKAMIEQLMTEDPYLKNIDKEVLLNNYATIYMFAPEISKDKNVVRELLTQFSKFGRVDTQTLNTLVNTEDKLKKFKMNLSVKIDPAEIGSALVSGMSGVDLS